VVYWWWITLTNKALTSLSCSRRLRNWCDAVNWLHPAEATPRLSLKLQAPTSAASNSHLPLHNPHRLHISHDSRTRPLAGAIAAVAGCAPLHCVIALAQSLRRPSCLGDAVRRLLLRFALDLHRALFRSRRPQLLSQAARLCTVSLPLARGLRRPGCLGDAVGCFLRQKHDTKDGRRQAKGWFEGTQRQIRHGLPSRFLLSRASTMRNLSLAQSMRLA
jgi:hypothetical protein